MLRSVIPQLPFEGQYSIMRVVSDPKWALVVLVHFNSDDHHCLPDSSIDSCLLSSKSISIQQLNVPF